VRVLNPDIRAMVEKDLCNFHMSQYSRPMQWGGLVSEAQRLHVLQTLDNQELYDRVYTQKRSIMQRGSCGLRRQFASFALKPEGHFWFMYPDPYRKIRFRGVEKLLYPIFRVCHILETRMVEPVLSSIFCEREVLQAVNGDATIEV